MIRIILGLYCLLTSQNLQNVHHSATLMSYFAQDPSRFIAHAGGIINGYKYTNSLEALNHNYANGFKLFELDILKTSDNHFVAVHDWKSWKTATEFLGSTPPTKAKFMQHKLHKQFSPMDINAINKWFSSNEDAILVTDKINDPAGFSRFFVDKSRLKMELFSWEAVLKGLQLEIGSSMPNGKLLSEIKGSEIAFLRKHNIKEMVISRKFIFRNKELIEKITQAGIKIYAYHINSKGGIGEKAVVCFENNNFFGIYADIWDFKNNLDCSLIKKQLTKTSNSS